MFRFSVFGWLKSRLRQARASQRWPGRRAIALPRRTVLRLEALEDRTLPSTFTVTDLLDNTSPGSLRWAVGQANSNPGPDTIAFATSVRGTITLTSGELRITDSVTINGPGASLLTVSGNQAARVFDVIASSVSIANLTITRGLASSAAVNGSNGGAIYHASGTLNLSHDGFSNNKADATTGADISDNYARGGAIFNAAGAVLHVTRGTFTGNVASATGGGPRGWGGAIYNAGTATITGSTLTGNLALGGTGGAPFGQAGGGGGAIANEGNVTAATLAISGSTFTSNQAIGATIAGGDGSTAAGGAIFDVAAVGVTGPALVTDSVVITGSTFTGNRALGGTATLGNQGGLALAGAI